MHVISCPWHPFSAVVSTQRGGLSSILALVLPRNAFEARALAAVCAVKFVALPLFGLVLIRALGDAGLLPASPICTLALLLQCVMPPAQVSLEDARVHECTGGCMD